MLEQVRLCAVWPMENLLGSSLNQIQGWTTVRESYSRALEQGHLGAERRLECKVKEGVVSEAVKETRPVSVMFSPKCIPLEGPTLDSGTLHEVASLGSSPCPRRQGIRTG